MPIFSRSRKGRDVSSGSVTAPTVSITEDEEPYVAPPPAEPIEEPKDPWLRREVLAEDVQELLHVCAQEMKSRALDMPMLLLPFRPFQTDLSTAKSFIRNYFRASVAARYGANGKYIYNDLKLIEPMALCSILKWCWSRLKGGVVTWNTYELFCIGEQKSRMAKHAFDKFIPISVNSPAHQRIVFDFFDLLAAIAANSKTNGLGARKLSRLAGWWAFDFGENTTDFDDAYKTWTRAADATTHLLFAYLRSLAPDSKVDSTMSQLPRVLQKLIADTEYPPAIPTVLQTETSKIVVLVDVLSATPLSLLRRARRLEYRNGDPGLQRLCLYDDGTKLLTPECRRVLECISCDSLSEPSQVAKPAAVPSEASWSRFEDIGFSSLLDGTASIPSDKAPSPKRSQPRQNHPLPDQEPPPSWSEFLVSGFADDGKMKEAEALKLPTEQILPPLRSSRDSLRSFPKSSKDDECRPGEVSRVDHVLLDETFWWVWMASLAGEESPRRKTTFSRCIVVETEMRGRRWLVLEERLRPVSPPPPPEAPEEIPIVVEKKHKFSFGKRTRGHRSVSEQKLEEQPPTEIEQENLIVQNQAAPGPDQEQQAKVQAAATALLQEKGDRDFARNLRRRGRKDDDAQSRAASIVTLEPGLLREAGPALQWARKFDKEIIRARYLGDAYAGRGSQLRELSPNLGGAMGQSKQQRALGKYELDNRDLPPLPRRSMLSLNLDALSLAAPTPPPGHRPSKREDQVRRGESPPLVANFTPLAQRTDGAKSLVPSPLVPRRKAPGSVDETIRERRIHTDPLAAQSAADAYDEPVHSRQSESPQRATSEAIEAEDQAPSPTASPQLKRGKNGSVRGLRKFFGKRNVSEPIAARRALFESSTAQQEQPKTVVKRSFLRRKVAAAASPPRETIQASPTPDSPTLGPETLQHSPVRDRARAREDDYVDEQPSPTNIAPFAPFHDHSAQVINATNTRDPFSSSPTFSSFTQGQVEDVPSWNHPPMQLSSSNELHMHIANFVPQHHLVIDPFHAPQPRPFPGSGPPGFQTRTAAMLYSSANAVEPTTPKFRLPVGFGADSDPDLTADEGSSENITPEIRGQVPEAQSRWAQIRQVAAERRASDEEELKQRQNSGAGQTYTAAYAADSGDVDGEESIEARVARIKARVAELTGSSPVLPPTGSYSKYIRA